METTKMFIRNIHENIILETNFNTFSDDIIKSIVNK